MRSGGWGGVGWGKSCALWYLVYPVFSSVSVFCQRELRACVRACVRSPFYARGYGLPFGVCGCDTVWYPALLWDTETIFRSAVVFDSIRGSLRSGGAGMMERKRGRKEGWKKGCSGGRDRALSFERGVKRRSFLRLYVEGRRGF